MNPRAASPEPVWRGRDVSDEQINIWVHQADAGYDIAAAMAKQGYAAGDPPLSEIVNGVRVPIPERDFDYAEAEFLILEGLKERLTDQQLVLITGVTMEVVLAPRLTRMIGILAYTLEDWHHPHREHSIVDDIAVAIEVREGTILGSGQWHGGHHVRARTDLPDLLRDYVRSGLPSLTCTPDPADLDEAADIIRAVVECRRYAIARYGEARPRTLTRAAADLTAAGGRSGLSEALERSFNPTARR